VTCHDIGYIFFQHRKKGALTFKRKYVLAAAQVSVFLAKKYLYGIPAYIILYPVEPSRQIPHTSRWCWELQSRHIYCRVRFSPYHLLCMMSASNARNASRHIKTKKSCLYLTPTRRSQHLYKQVNAYRCEFLWITIITDIGRTVRDSPTIFLDHKPTSALVRFELPGLCSGLDQQYYSQILNCATSLIIERCTNLTSS